MIFTSTPRRLASVRIPIASRSGTKLVAYIGRTDGVEQDFDGHARARLGRYGLGEFPPDLARPKDVRLERDRASRLPDGLEHGRIELIAVVENVNPVARHERRVGRAGHRGQELRRFDGEIMVETVLRRFLYGVDEKDRDAQQGETENE